MTKTKQQANPYPSLEKSQSTSTVKKGPAEISKQKRASVQPQLAKGLSVSLT